MEQDRRAIYRVRPQTGDNLELAVSHGQDVRQAEEVLDITIDGAGTRFPRERAPALALGDRVTLAISSPDLSAPIELAAQVVSRAEHGDQRHYSFRFEDPPQDRDRALPGEAYRLLNRRRAPRTKLRPTDQPVEIGLAVSQRHGYRYSAIARLNNISITGLGALASAEVDRALSGVRSVEVELRFPDTGRAVSLVGEIRNREPHGDMVYYGVRFDAGQTRDYLDKAEDIVEYILTHAREHPTGSLH